MIVRPSNIISCIRICGLKYNVSGKDGIIMYFFLLIIIGLLVFLIIHPFINRHSGNNYTDRLTKIYGGFTGPLVVSVIGSWFGDTLIGLGPEIQSFGIIGGLIGAIILVCIWDYVLIMAGRK